MPAAPTTPAVSVHGLVKQYAGRPVVDGLDLTAEAGAVTALLGPNGAGKTTTVEVCEGLRAADGGEVRVLGLPPGDRRLRPRVGVMLQDGGLPAAARAGDVLGHVARLHGRPAAPADVVEALGVADFARTPVRRLSVGQAKRLALAAAVVGDPEVVFLDEPSAGMDPHARVAVWDLVRALRDRGVAVVLTTHLMDEAEALADHVVVVDRGRTVASGTVRELLHGTGEATLRLVTEPAVDPAVLAAALGREVTTTREGGLAVAGAADPALLAAVAAWCAERDVLLRRTTVGAGRLEQVVLELTGGAAADGVER